MTKNQGSEAAVGKHAVSGSGLHEGLNPSEPPPSASSAASVYYVVIDRVSANLLGEFDHRQHAEEFRHELAEANGGSYHGLVVVEVDAE